MIRPALFRIVIKNDFLEEKRKRKKHPVLKEHEQTSLYSVPSLNQSVPNLNLHYFYLISINLLTFLAHQEWPLSLYVTLEIKA